MTNLKYTHYTAEEFADDKEFWLWVLQEDAAQDVFWRQFISDNPAKAKDIEQARAMVLQVNATKHKLENKKVSTLWERIQNSKAAIDTTGNTEPINEQKKEIAFRG